MHHPTAQASLPLILTDSAQPCAPRLHSEFDEAALHDALSGIALECGFVCLTMINAVADQDVIPPAWRQAVTEFLTTIAADADWSHLERDWAAETQRFKDLAAHVITAEQLPEALANHPNSIANLRSRQDTPEP